MSHFVPASGLSFNPRPRVGGDTAGRGHGDNNHCFNPRPRVGGDVPEREHGQIPTVSIHAPVWGATCPGDYQGGQPGVSIHAPVWGATGRKGGASKSRAFQSTPPCGGRHRSKTRRTRQWRFNPRPRVGGDGVAQT